MTENRDAATRSEFEPRVMRVDCSQFATCQWHGKRLVTQLGVQPEPCPKCGKEVIA